MCACTHKRERPCGNNTTGELQALTLCFLLCFVTCFLCHWIPSISGPLLLYLLITYTSVFTHCLLVVGQRANAGSLQEFHFQDARLRDVISLRNPKSEVPTPRDAKSSSRGYSAPRTWVLWHRPPAAAPTTCSRATPLPSPRPIL